MNWDEIKGKWTQLCGTVKEKWGKLTDDDMAQINGQRDKLIGKVQEIYGYTRNKAEQEVKDFERQCNC